MSSLQTPAWRSSTNSPMHQSALPPALPVSLKVPERKPKLRASCDSCAASKVKCSKEHPTCVRCAANGSICVYGISRKHGKPGRTRKPRKETNPDTAAGVSSEKKKTSKQRPSPDGKEFHRFRIRPEPLPELDEAITPTTETSSFLEATEHMDLSDDNQSCHPSFAMMDDDIYMPQPISPISCLKTIDPELTFTDPFAKRTSLALEPADFQALKDFVGGDAVHPMEYTFDDMDKFEYDYHHDSLEDDIPQSPRGSYFDASQQTVDVPPTHNCYDKAYAILETLHFRNSQTPSEYEANATQDLDGVLSVTKNAVAGVLELLNCACASDPHLAMLYSSIASKILSWYQSAAGLKPCNLPTPALTTASSPSFSSPPSSSSSVYSSPNTSAKNMSITLQPLKIGAFEFEEADQEALRRHIIVRELKKAGVLVEALANWRGEEGQAEFLYDVLGAWLKSELWRTIKDVEGEEES